MAHSNGKITAPVSFADVQAVLGVSSTDLATLCRHANVNKWARYKPVINNIISTLDQWDSANNTWKSTANWYKSNAANNYNCGVSMILSDASDPNLRNLVTTYKNGISRIVPTGGSSSPYRLTDFAGYNHNAKPFISSNKAKDYVFNLNLFLRTSIDFSVNYNIDDSALKMEDFVYLDGENNDIALGVALYSSDPRENTSLNPTSVTTAESSIYNGGTVTLSFGSDAVDCWVMLFLQNMSISRRYALPFDNDNYGIFKIHIYSDASEVLFMTMGAVTIKNGSTVIEAGYRMSEYNSNNRAMTVANNYSYIIQTTIQNKKSSALTIGGSSSQFTFLLCLQNRSYSGSLYAVSNSDQSTAISVTIPANSSSTVLMRADSPFSGWWDSYLPSVININTNIYIQAVPSSGSGDFVCSDTLPIYVKR